MALDNSKWYVEKTRKIDHSDTKLSQSKLTESLLSRKTNKRGRKIYKNMEKIRPGDYVLHLVMDEGNSFIGVSQVKESAKDVRLSPENSRNEPDETDGYQVLLENFKPLKKNLKFETIRNKREEKLKNISNKKDLFYNTKLKLAQGKYLTNAPIELVSLINDVYREESGENLPYFDPLDGKNQGVSESEPPDTLKIKNIILHGPVGTGKTYISHILANGIINGTVKSYEDIEKILAKKEENSNDQIKKPDSQRIVNVTFHQSYGYEDFIEGIRAETDEKEETNLTYHVKPGIFKELCTKASNDKGNKYVLIVDEINRGDISRIFGEIITLIEEDKRDGQENRISLTLPYSGEKLSVPDNLYIIGTMNDSDKSIALLDVALRRRFAFFNVPPDPKVIDKWISNYDKKDMVIKSFEGLNKRISDNKGEDFQIGHAFFKELETSKSLDKDLLHIFKYKIIPLLKEIFYGRDEILYGNILKGKFYSKKDGNRVYKLKEDLLDTDQIEKFLIEFQGLSE